MLIRLPRNYVSLGCGGGWGEPFRGVVFYDDVICEMGSSISWEIKSSSVRTRHLREVQQQLILHVKNAMGKCVYHILVAACLLLGFEQGQSICNLVRILGVRARG